MPLELLSLGLDFAGGLYGQRKADKAQKRQLAAARHQFDQQMDHSITRRVEDAKRAGVHPLFALGASSGASPTISAGEGQGGRPMQAALTSMAQTLGVIEQNRASAKRDESEAALLDSQRKRIEQELVGPRGNDAEALQELEVVPKMRGTVIGPAAYYSPQVAKSQRTGVAAGTHPEKIELVDTEGRTHTIPNPDLGLDEIAQVEYAYNKSRHWSTDRIEEYIRGNRSMSAKAKRFFMQKVYPTFLYRPGKGTGQKLDREYTDWIAP